MPFIAEKKNGDRVTPEQSNPDDDLICPKCDTGLTIRDSHYREGSFVARHFVHLTESKNCVGESPRHQYMKSVAASKAREKWEGSEVKVEEPVGDRRADVLVKPPDDSEHIWADGIAIECQHKNKAKNKNAVEYDYAKAGYSTLWVHDEHFEGKDVSLDSGRLVVGWPKLVPQPSEWSGYEWDGVVDRKTDDKTSVEFEFPIEWIRKDAMKTPSETDHIRLNKKMRKYGFRPIGDEIREAWEKGYYTADKNLSQFVDWNYGWEDIETVFIGNSRFVKLSVSPTGEYVLLISKPGESTGVQITTDKADEIRGLGVLLSKLGDLENEEKSEHKQQRFNA